MLLSFLFPLFVPILFVLEFRLSLFVSLSCGLRKSLFSLFLYLFLSLSFSFCFSFSLSVSFCFSFSLSVSLPRSCRRGRKWHLKRMVDSEKQMVEKLDSLESKISMVSLSSSTSSLSSSSSSLSAFVFLSAISLSSPPVYYFVGFPSFLLSWRTWLSGSIIPSQYLG